MSKFLDALHHEIKIGDILASGEDICSVGIVVGFTEVSARVIPVGHLREQFRTGPLSVKVWNGKTTTVKTTSAAYGRPGFVVNGIFEIIDGDQNHVKVKDNSIDAVYVIEQVDYNKLQTCIKEQRQYR